MNKAAREREIEAMVGEVSELAKTAGETQLSAVAQGVRDASATARAMRAAGKIALEIVMVLTEEARDRARRGDFSMFGVLLVALRYEALSLKTPKAGHLADQTTFLMGEVLVSCRHEGTGAKAPALH